MQNLQKGVFICKENCKYKIKNEAICHKIISIISGNFLSVNGFSSVSSSQPLSSTALVSTDRNVRSLIVLVFAISSVELTATS